MKYKDKLLNLRTRREMLPTTISDELLFEAIEHVRLGCTARNAQPLRYALINDPQDVLAIFNTTNLPTMHGVSEQQKPSAFIVIGVENELVQNNLMGTNFGIAVQIIREYLFEEKYDSICINSFNREETKDIIGITNFSPDCLIAIGKSDQVVHVVDSISDVSNYRNERNEHTTRKLTAESLIVNKPRGK